MLRHLSVQPEFFSPQLTRTHDGGWHRHMLHKQTSTPLCVLVPPSLSSVIFSHFPSFSFFSRLSLHISPSLSLPLTSAFLDPLVKS